jgi:hypothetical protein
MRDSIQSGDIASRQSSGVISGRRRWGSMICLGCDDEDDDDESTS